MLHWHRITWNLAGRECRLHGRPVWVIKPPRIRRLSFCMIRSHPRWAALAVNSRLTVFIPAESRGFISGVLEIAWFYVHADCLSACRPASWCSCKHAVASRHLLPSSALDSDTILAFPGLLVRTLNAWWEICPLKVQCQAPLCHTYVTLVRIIPVPDFSFYTDDAVCCAASKAFNCNWVFVSV